MVFVDTNFFFALASSGDPDSERVREVLETFDWGRVPHLWLTTNYVVFETPSPSLERLDGRSAAVRICARHDRVVWLESMGDCLE